MTDALNFARTPMLFWIWAVPVLFLVFLYGIRKRRRLLRRFADARTLPALAPMGDRRWLRAGLMLVVVLLGILALAGPRYGFQWEEIQQQGVELVVALDCSRSMLATDVSPTRLDRAKREIFDLLGRLRGDRVGLVAFAGTAFLQCPLTIDYAAFYLFLDALGPDLLPVGGTDLAAAVRTSLDAFGAPTEADRAVILITDGEQTGEGDPLEAARAAADADVRLFCIGVGGASGVPVPDPEGGLRKDAAGNIVITRLDEATLRQMATTTGGTYVRSVAGDMDLDTIYERDIRGRLEAAAIEGGRRRVWEDRYQWPLGLAVLALLVEMLLPPVPGNGRGRKVLPVVLMLAVAAAPGAARAESRFHQGMTAYQAGEFEAALDHFLQAQVSRPDDPRVLYNIGNAYYRLGEFDAAARHFEMAANAEGADPELRQQALYNLGNARFRAREYETALETYDAAIAAARDLQREDRQAAENRAFVEKVMQQPPPPSKESSPSGDSDDSESEEESSDSAQGAPGTESGEDSASPGRENQADSGARPPESDAGDGAESERPPSASGGGSSAEPGGEESAAPPPPIPDEEAPAEAESASDAAVAEAGESEEESVSEAAAAQAERILNRLQDQPGRALIPRYGERKVERDW